VQGIRIAVDAAGGDQGGRKVIAGALSAARHLGFGLTLVGPVSFIKDELKRQENSIADEVDVRVVSANQVIAMDEGPRAVRRKPNASVKVAAEVVASGDAAAFFSAGNTGATLVAAHSVFGMMSGVERPALATTIPTRHRDAVLLDVGATIDCRPRHLLQFAAMGTVYAKKVLGIENPRVGLLSIGEEAIKGNDLTRDAYQLLSESRTQFIGNLEARDLYGGDADVIVCDGFTGNVALKVSEGLVEVVEDLLRDELNRTFTTQLGYLLSRRSYRRFRRRVDYSEYGGAPLLGVTGLAVVGHGRSSIKAVRNALALTYRFVREGFVRSIDESMTALDTERSH
jgi:glycerol-3-phosphate acyltransferase PlsX|tara:strand:+ start:20004 stop:21026 length:1023 start_codon:yes stop_codon:yes gene_type:complete